MTASNGIDATPSVISMFRVADGKLCHLSWAAGSEEAVLTWIGQPPQFLKPAEVVNYRRNLDYFFEEISKVRGKETVVGDFAIIVRS
jgi:hypothetical protein